MSLSVQQPLVRAEILRLLQATVLHAAPVYDYVRDVAHAADLQTIALDADVPPRLHFWMFGLSAADPIAQAKRQPGSLSRVVLSWDIFGYYALQDAVASEKTFDAEAALVFDAFEAAKKLPNIAGVATVTESGPAVRSAGGAILIGSTLCNFARFSLPTVLHLEY